MNSPFVAVFMVTYNHESYISQAIESVLMQKTSFPIELFIGEDCSTDKTASICLKYQAEYPEIIEVICQKQNIGATNNALKIFEKCFSSGAKYIAMIEGDDYWTDPFKLQKQIIFLEHNLDYSICFHEIEILRGQSYYSNNITIDVPDSTTLNDLAQGNYIHTCSVVYRNHLIDKFPTYFSKSPVGDYYLYLLLARHGKIKKLRDIMAVYRIHENSLWSSLNSDLKNIKWAKFLIKIQSSFDRKTCHLLNIQFAEIAFRIFKYDRNKNYFYLILSIYYSPIYSLKRILKHKKLFIE